MKKGKWLGLGVLTLASVLTLAACGGKKDDAKTSGSDVKTEETKKKKLVKQTLHTALQL